MPVLEVVSAPQHEVVEIGWALLGFPLLEVVDLTPSGWDVADGHAAPAVSGH